MIRFPAHKNRKRCQTRIEPRLIPFFERYKDIVSKCKDGDVYLFPKSRAQKSGTEKKNKLHITDATIAKWLAYVRDKTSEECNLDIRKFPRHSYCHSIAMRYLNSGCQYEDVAGVLGDTIATIEKHYSELIFTPARFKKHGGKHIVLQRKFPQKEQPNLHLFYEKEDSRRIQVTCKQYPIQGLWTLLEWWTLGDLNPRPSGCKPDALPTSKRPQGWRSVSTFSMLPMQIVTPLGRLWHLCQALHQLMCKELLPDSQSA